MTISFFRTYHVELKTEIANKKAEWHRTTQSKGSRYVKP